MPQMQGQQGYRFGAFSLDDSRGCLRRGDTHIALRPKTFELLRHFVTHPDRLLGKEELLAAVWPDVVVTEDSLTRCVSELRAALADGAPNAIRTLPKRGYLFAEPVHRADASHAFEHAASGALIGRDADLAELAQWLGRHSLVTITGAGGIGKTRLAQALSMRVARVFSDAVCWVDLASVAAADQVVPAVAEAARVRVGERDAATHLRHALAGRHLLLVLDNCEHLSESVAGLAGALLQSSTAGLRILATSREPLHAAHEYLYRLDALPVPLQGTPLALACSFASLRLLEERTLAVDRQFAISTDNLADLIDICHQLDGIPLAIEMAAARLPVLGPQGLRQRLGERLRLLRNRDRAAPPHQQTLAATLDWSHSLLGANEQIVLRRLSVFSGSFRLDAAQQVAAADGLDEWQALDALTALVDKSLVQVVDGVVLRYRLLETTRLYAKRRLQAAGELEATLLRHGRAMAAIAMQVRSAYFELPDAEVLDRFGADAGELQAAFERACERCDAEVAADTVVALRSLDQLRGNVSGMLARLHAAHALLPGASLRARARLCTFIASCGWVAIPDMPTAAAAREAVRAWRESGSTSGLQHALWLLGTECARAGDFDAADAMLAEARQLQRPGRPKREMMAAIHAGYVSSFRRDWDGRVRHLNAALALAPRAGAPRLAAYVQIELADALLCAGRIDAAVAQAERAVREVGEAGRNLHAAHAQLLLCRAQFGAGNLPAARAVARHLLALTSAHDIAGDLFEHLATWALRDGDFAAAARLSGYADARRSADGTRRQFDGPCELDGLASALGAQEHARLREQGAALAHAEAETIARTVLGPD